MVRNSYYATACLLSRKAPAAGVLFAPISADGRERMGKTILSLLILAAAVPGLQAAGMVAATSPGESPRHKIIRRLVGAAACGLSAIDGAESSANAGSRGFVEGNPVLSNHGQLRTGRMIAFKVGACAAPFVLGEWGAAHRNRTLEEWGLWTGAGSAAAFGATLIHNRQVLGQTK